MVALAVHREDPRQPGAPGVSRPKVADIPCPEWIPARQPPSVITQGGHQLTPSTALAIQHVAGNVALGSLLSGRNAIPAVTVQRCGDHPCEGDCDDRERDEQDGGLATSPLTVQRAPGTAAEPPRPGTGETHAADVPTSESSQPSSSAADGASCPQVPDPAGEWRTEPWLCNMRGSAIGDNSYLLAHEWQRGAKGDARGRSVELIYAALRAWMCEQPAAAGGVTVPGGSTYTSASARAVSAFQTWAG